MAIYKELSGDDISYREIYAYKEWVLTQADGIALVMYAMKVENSAFYWWLEPTASGDIYNRTLYDSVKHLYYNLTSLSEYTGSYTNPAETGSWSVNKFYEPYFNFGLSGKGLMYRNFHDSCKVISVPQNLFGYTIKPKSVYLEDVTVGFTLVDDGYGNLYDADSSASFAANKATYTLGNVFYEHGNMVITNTGSSPHNYLSFGTGSNTYTVKFRGTEKIHEIEAICIAKEGEFNMTMNPSARVSRSLYTTEPLRFVTGSNFAPYVTTVGLYDSDLNLLAIGKLAQPVRNDPDLPLTIVVRLDL